MVTICNGVDDRSRRLGKSFLRHRQALRRDIARTSTGNGAFHGNFCGTFRLLDRDGSGGMKVIILFVVRDDGRVVLQIGVVVRVDIARRYPRGDIQLKHLLLSLFGEDLSLFKTLHE